MNEVHRCRLPLGSRSREIWPHQSSRYWIKKSDCDIFTKALGRRCFIHLYSHSIRDATQSSLKGELRNIQTQQVRVQPITWSPTTVVNGAAVCLDQSKGITSGNPIQTSSQQMTVDGFLTKVSLHLDWFWKSPSNAQEIEGVVLEIISFIIVITNWILWSIISCTPQNWKHIQNQISRIIWCCYGHLNVCVLIGNTNSVFSGFVHDLCLKEEMESVHTDLANTKLGASPH